MHVDAVALAAPEHLEAAVHQPLAVHARADADLVQQIDADLLEHAGADAAEHVRARLALEDHGVDAGLGQQLAEQQARGAGADDRDLGPERARHARVHSLAPLRVRRRRRGHEREQRPRRVGLARARADGRQRTS